MNCDCGATPDDPIHYPGCAELDGDRDDPSDHYDL
jgi:hypothetical protein